MLGVRIPASHEVRLSYTEEGRPEVMKTVSKKRVVIGATPAPTSTGEPMAGQIRPVQANLQL